MNLVQKANLSADRHYSPALDILRMVLGVVILAKGIFFAQNTNEILTMLHNSKVEFLSFMLVNYVVMAHLVGGVLIILGLLTRTAIACQIPILLGAVIFVNSSDGFYSIHSGFLLSLGVLLMLCYFFYYGAGHLSLDYYMKKHRGV